LGREELLLSEEDFGGSGGGGGGGGVPGGGGDGLAVAEARCVAATGDAPSYQVEPMPGNAVRPVEALTGGGDAAAASSLPSRAAPRLLLLLRYLTGVTTGDSRGLCVKSSGVGGDSGTSPPTPHDPDVAAPIMSGSGGAMDAGTAVGGCCCIMANGKGGAAEGGGGSGPEGGARPSEGGGLRPFLRDGTSAGTPPGGGGGPGRAPGSEAGGGAPASTEFMPG
jgi:hypothetical protein